MTKQELIEKLESEEIPISVFGVDVDPLVVEGKLNLILKFLKEGDSRGTDVMYDGVYQEIVNFISDPQAQINSLKESIAGNINGIAHLNDLKLDKTECTLQFNQMFNTNTSTLPSGSGLTITNIFGGHHIEGTTDSQYYHTMYNIDTINGHKYYFAANFSEKANVYIVGKVDSSSFNTKDEKIFVGGDNFNITLQIERDKGINTDLKPILVDLTRMFGVGKEPQNEQEVQEYLIKGTYYPYSDKPSKDEINDKMIGAPSNTIDFDVIKLDIINNSYIVPTNGYIHFKITSQDATTQLYYNIDNLYFQNTIGAWYAFTIMLPVSKGQTLKAKVSQLKLSVSQVNFIHAKEI